MTNWGLGLIFQETWKIKVIRLHPAGDTTVYTEWMTTCLIAVEIFQSALKWWINWLTDSAKPTATRVVWLKTIIRWCPAKTAHIIYHANCAANPTMENLPRKKALLSSALSSSLKRRLLIQRHKSKLKDSFSLQKLQSAPASHRVSSPPISDIQPEAELRNRWCAVTACLHENWWSIAAAYCSLLCGKAANEYCKFKL